MVFFAGSVKKGDWRKKASRKFYGAKKQDPKFIRLSCAKVLRQTPSGKAGAFGRLRPFAPVFFGSSSQNLHAVVILCAMNNGQKQEILFPVSQMGEKLGGVWVTEWILKQKHIELTEKEPGLRIEVEL